MRPRTITVDVSRGGDYALADYRRQGEEHMLLRRMERVGSGVYHFKGDNLAWVWRHDDAVESVPVGIVQDVSADGKFVTVLMDAEVKYA